MNDIRKSLSHELYVSNFLVRLYQRLECVLSTVDDEHLQGIHNFESGGRLLQDQNNFPAYMSNYIHYMVWDVIISPLPTSKGAIVKVRYWISNFIHILYRM